MDVSIITPSILGLRSSSSGVSSRVILDASGTGVCPG